MALEFSYYTNENVWNFLFYLSCHGLNLKNFRKKWVSVLLHRLIDTGEGESLGGQSASCTDTHVQDDAIRDGSKHVIVQSPACEPASQAALPLAFHAMPILPLCWHVRCLEWIKRNVYAGKSISRHVSTGGWCWCLPLFLKCVSSYWKFYEMP